MSEPMPASWHIRTLGLDQPVPADIYGGKASTLHLLKKAGLPVPPGVAVPHYWLGQSDDERPSTLSIIVEVGDRMEDIAAREGLPHSAFPMMVRSSALAEDGVDASFAGRYESLTDIYLGSGNLYDAMIKIRESARAPRVKEYAKKRGIPFDSVSKVGIVVQRMILTELSAVFFTRHPMGEEGAYVEIAEGHGENLVAGKVQPIYSGDPALLKDDYIGTLVKHAFECERLIGKPADVEAAYDGRKWWIVQARPITTLEE